VITRLLNRDQWLIFSAFLLWGLSNGLWLHLQPLYLESLGARPEQVGAALGLAGLGVVFLYVPVGLVADRTRRKPIIVGAWITGTVATVLLALAPDWRWVIPGLALYLFSAFSRPAIAGYIAASDGSGNLTRVFSVLSSGYSIGSIVGPALGGWIAETSGLRVVLYVATGFAVLSTIATLLLTDTPSPAPERGRATNPWQLLSNRYFVWQIVVLMLMIFALDLGTILMPTFLQDERGLNLQQIGQLGTVASVGMLAIMLVVSQMRPERRQPLLLTQLVVGASLALLLVPAPAWRPAAFGLLALAYFCRGGVESIWPVTRARVTRGIDPRSLSFGFALMDTGAQVARTISPIAAGYLYAQHPTLPLYGGLIALAATLLLTLTLPQARPQPLGESAALPAEPQSAEP
jgi:MFS family permease